jgi:segregation and condensation protein A
VAASTQPVSLTIVPDADIILPTGGNSHDGVEILVNMAKAGQIDPWNLDLTAVADQYLQTVQQLKQSDLRITGKVLLYLAILLRMKSDILTHGAAFWLNDDALAQDDYLGDDNDPMAGLPLPNVVSLQTVLKRKTSVRQNRIRPVTLTDLITELQKIETLEQRQALKRAFTKMESRRGQSVDLGSWTIEEIETLAHEEFVEDTLESVSEAIDNTLHQGVTVTLTQLVRQLQLDTITVFLALLFLAARTDIELSQADFYGPLVINKVTPLAGPSAE